MRREDFVKEYMRVRKESFRPSTIISAFKKSGAWPIDRTVFTDDDYAPSIPYSTEALDFLSLPEDASDSDSDLLNSDSDDSDNDSDDDSGNNSHQSPMSSTPSLPSTLPASSSSISPVSSETAPTLSAATPGPSRMFTFPPVSTARFYHDPVLFDRILQLEGQVQQLSGHVKMVKVELQNEKRKSNERDGRASKRRKLNVEARVLTSAEGRRFAEEKEAEQAAKAQKKRDAAIRRKEKEVERDRQHRARGPDAPFTGSLTSKNKPDLKEIAAALDITEDGTKDALIQHINAFFDSNPSLRESPRFSGLFHRASRRHPRETENTQPTPSTSQIAPRFTPTTPLLATNIINLPNFPPVDPFAFVPVPAMAPALPSSSNRNASFPTYSYYPFHTNTNSQ